MLRTGRDPILTLKKVTLRVPRDGALGAQCGAGYNLSRPRPIPRSLLDPASSVSAEWPSRPEAGVEVRGGKLPAVEPPYVISCSRRTDVAACYTDWLAAALGAGVVGVASPYGGRTRRVSLRPQDVHSIVFTSKDYRRLLANQAGVRERLEAYEQVFFHLTITGLGGGPLEPRVPPWPEVAAQLPELVAWAGDARRVTVRFDPIVHWREGEAIRSNLASAEAIFDVAAAAGVCSVRVSIAAIYPKMRRRGFEWYDPGPEERADIAGHLSELAAARGLKLYACADPTLVRAGIRPSACVDGALLAALHPRRLPAPTHKDPGQRPACGCTPSVDIGSYRMKCPHGCRYCYAAPVVKRGK